MTTGDRPPARGARRLQAARPRSTRRSPAAIVAPDPRPRRSHRALSLPALGQGGPPSRWRPVARPSRSSRRSSATIPMSSTTPGNSRCPGTAGSSRRPPDAAGGDPLAGSRPPDAQADGRPSRQPGLADGPDPGADRRGGLQPGRGLCVGPGEVHPGHRRLTAEAHEICDKLSLVKPSTWNRRASALSSFAWPNYRRRMAEPRPRVVRGGASGELLREAPTNPLARGTSSSSGDGSPRS